MSTTPPELVEKRPSSPWTLWAWLMVGGGIISIAAGVLGGILAPSVVLDVVSLWPLAAGAFFVAAALLPLRKRGPARISAVLPLLLITMLGVSVVLHLIGWRQLPSASADIAGPPPDGVEETELRLDLSGRLSVSVTGAGLYSVHIERSGGTVGVPEALESDFEDGPLFVVLRENDGGRWFQTAGWELDLSPAPRWSLALGSPDLRADLDGLTLRTLAVGGAGTLTLPAPFQDDVEITVDGDFLIELPDEVAVRVIGRAAVPGGWVETVDGFQSPFPGPALVITVVDGSAVEIVGRP